MNATTLHTITGLKVSQCLCLACQAIWPDYRLAEDCCVCIDCRAASPRRIPGSRCEKCSEAFEAKQNAEKIANAEKVESWEGPVYWEGTGNEGYHSNVAEFVQEWKSSGKGELPEFVFTCEEEGFPGAHYHEIVEVICDQMFAGAENYIEGEDDLKKAIAAFNEANSKLKTWTPNLKRMVRVPAE